MPGTFTYDEATNTIQVINGTSGSPATFNDMYVADQAGVATGLLPAEAGVSGPGNTLTYAIRPALEKALIIKCIVAAKTAEADFIFITGTDAWGAAQTESLDVTVGNGIYTTTKRFASASSFDCSDNAAGGGAQWADGTIQVTQGIWGVIWEFSADEHYQIDCIIKFGDDATATYFQSKNEMVFFIDTMNWTIEDNATLEIGDLQDGYGYKGSEWSSKLTASYDAITSGDDNASFLMYDTVFHERDTADRSREFEGGTVDIRNSKQTASDAGSGRSQIKIGSSTITQNIQRFSTTGCGAGLDLVITPDVFEDYWSHRNNKGILLRTGLIANTPQIASYRSSFLEQNANNRVCRLRDHIGIVDTPQISAGNGTLTEEYTINIHFVDKEGNDLSGVAVTIKDTDDKTLTVANSGAVMDEDLDLVETALDVDDGTKFSINDVIKIRSEFMLITNIVANTLTLTRGYYPNYIAEIQSGVSGTFPIDKVQVVTSDANGDITEQVAEYRRWFGTSEILTTFSPHEFTFTKAGFKSVVIKGFVITDPIKWEIVMEGAHGAMAEQWR